jgi:hypothetical protein
MSNSTKTRKPSASYTTSEGQVITATLRDGSKKIYEIAIDGTFVRFIYRCGTGSYTWDTEIQAAYSWTYYGSIKDGSLLISASGWTEYESPEDRLARAKEHAERMEAVVAEQFTVVAAEATAAQALTDALSRMTDAKAFEVVAKRRDEQETNLAEAKRLLQVCKGQRSEAQAEVARLAEEV